MTAGGGSGGGGGGQAREPLRKLRHDLANPLSAILAEAQILLLSPEKYDEETVQSLKQIEILARKMRQILQDLDA